MTDINNMNSVAKQVISLPSMIESLYEPLSQSAKDLVHHLGNQLSTRDRFYLFGCGDSCFVGLTTALAFDSMTNLSMSVASSLQFSRYIVPNLKDNAKRALALGISVSGNVSRTREGIIQAERQGVPCIAMTANNGPFAQSASHRLMVNIPAFSDPEPNGTPGVRSFMSNQLLLLLLAAELGLTQKTLSRTEYEKFKADIRLIPTQLQQTIDQNEHLTEEIINTWESFDEYVFVGAGPNYGSALFSAAKFIEASGDFAMAQETEEWAHLNYYNRRKNTPTIFISSGQQDLSRTQEVALAAHSVGRNVLIIAPSDLAPEFSRYPFLSIPDCDERLSPFFVCTLSSLMASHRATLINETYFRKNNTVETSRIRSSEVVA